MKVIVQDLSRLSHSLLNQSQFFVFQMIAYFATFEMFLEENVPSLYQHFIQENFTPDMYLIDW